MKLQLFQNKIKEGIEIYYREMTPTIEHIVRLVDADQIIEDIMGKDSDGTQIILDPKDILYFESVDKKCFAYTKNKTYQIQPSLSDLESAYHKKGFVRINKSNVVNIYHVNAIKPEVNMRIKAVLMSGESLLINRSYKKTFESFLKEKRSLK